MTELDRDAFNVLAAQAGLDPDDPHLNDLYPDVQALLARLAMLQALDHEGAEPILTYTPREQA